MNVYWLVQSKEDVPEQNEWLSSSELSFLRTLRFDQRRASWRLGRWTAKCAVGLYASLPYAPQTLATVEIRPVSSGAPQVFVENKPAAITISLSHRCDQAFCAITPPNVELGCDLEAIEPHSGAFLADYFTVEEQAMVMQQRVAERALFVALLWSGKESALKGLHEGLRLDTRSVIVEIRNFSADRSSWNPLEVRYKAGHLFHGWWQIANGMVQTVVAAPRPALPVALPAPDHVLYGSALVGGKMRKAVFATGL